MKAFLSLVIPTHNSQQKIGHLLSSIKNSKFKNFDDIELVIIDDGSTDSTVDYVKKLITKLNCPVRVIPIKKNIGPARSRNFGVKHARGSFVLFLDSDVQLKKQSLQNAYNLVKKGKVNAFTGIWHYHQTTNKFFPKFKALRDWSYWSVERKKNAHYYLFSTRVAGIKKSLFRRLGGFNRDYPEPTVEDIELTYRIEKLSPITFAPNIVVNHEFEDFLPIAIKYFKRSRDWVRLYLERYRFDPVATSQKEAIKSIISSLFLIFLLTSIFLRPFIYLAMVLGVTYIYFEVKFWLFLYKKEGWSFVLKAIPTSFALYFIVNLGAVVGLLQYYLKKLSLA